MADNKSTQVVEKDQLIIEGEIYADSFRDRKTGKSIDIAGESEWEKSLKDKIAYDESGNQVVVNKKVHIEGQDSSGVGLKVDEKAEFGELMLDNLSHLQNTNGDSLIQLVTKAEFEGEFVYKVGVVYVVYDTDGTCYIRYYVS